MKKIEQAQQFLQKNESLFRCPICYHSFYLNSYSLICKNNHQFDLSKKGTLYFLNHQVKTEYSKKMLIPRGNLIKNGMYQQVLDAIQQKITAMNGITLDIGCGEGSFLTQLTERGLNGFKIGFDISKDGIYLASSQPVGTGFWDVADLTNLPISSDSIDTIINIFSPAYYQEFTRVLKKDGKIIKIIPEIDYLKELRQIFYPGNEQKQFYSNQKVIERFEQAMIIEEKERITYTFSIPKHCQLDLLEMSPLEWQVSSEIKQRAQQYPLAEITIDICLLKGRKK